MKHFVTKSRAGVVVVIIRHISCASAAACHATLVFTQDISCVNHSADRKEFEDLAIFKDSQ